MYLLKAGHVAGGTWGGVHFRPRGHNLNKLGRGPLGDATYQIPMLYTLWFQTRRFFSCFYILAYVKHVTPGVGPRDII